MDTLLEFRTAVQSDLSIGSESSFFDSTNIDLAINRAYIKIGSMFKWVETRDAQKTSAKANKNYYNYPTNWRPYSIWKITVDDVDMGEPIAYEDFLYEQENNYPSGLTKLWANYAKRFFLDPTPTADGNYNIKIWGYKFVDALELDGDITIFSYSMPEVNEAIVMEAVEILKDKSELNKSKRDSVVVPDLLSSKARSIVVSSWSKISQENSKIKKTQPQWSVPDFFGNTTYNVRNNIGNF